MVKRMRSGREKDDDSDSENAELEALVTRRGTGKCNDLSDPTDEFFLMTRGIREALRTLENKVKDLEKKQTTILATPLPEDSKSVKEEKEEGRKEVRKEREAPKMPQLNSGGGDNLGANDEIVAFKDEGKEQEEKSQASIFTEGDLADLKSSLVNESESMKQDLQKLRDEIKELAKDIQGRLKKIEPKKDEEDENRNSINSRMKRTQHGILSQQFLDLINKCNSIQSEYRDRNLERIKRQLQITDNRVVSDEELDQMLESGQTEVFVSNGEIIDRIEKNILDSEDYVKKGQVHLHKAQENQKKARKKKFMIAICLLITVVIIIAIIAISIMVG
ncbi:hypothetical protein JD844_001277 [Phrynosoma platyrhinos]|uniref:t-SNARE coiled-coil homology domain-containing protein n=1 Tax=Phrynosoma platyrhinos TaxID=52577 RepID=A0ABQ7T9D8_PHRPL|nr:hypothetical protein JD844_001277 [Phrynosoma platyrhinos]